MSIDTMHVVEFERTEKVRLRLSIDDEETLDSFARGEIEPGKTVQAEVVGRELSDWVWTKAP